MSKAKTQQTGAGTAATGAVVPSNPNPCAWAVIDGALMPDPHPKHPDDLYFYRPTGHTGDVPQDQEDAKQALEKFVRDIRIILRTKHRDKFDEFFRRAVSTAQSVFDPVGFRPEPLHDLEGFREEIVQMVGGSIKADYIRRMALSTLIASLLIIAVTVLVHQIGRTLSSAGAIVTSDQVDRADGKGSDKTIKQKEVVNLIRWDEGFTIGHLGVLLAAAMWGLFLAACIRNFEPSFEKLKSPDADLMPPWSRLLFFGIIILGFALILDQRMVTVAFGDTFSTANISKDLRTALIIGLLLGVAERALPKKFERWSGELVTSIDKGAETT